MSNTILLIEELTPAECNLIQEASADGKSLYMRGVFMQGGIKNKNGRVYSVNELSAQVENATTRIKAQNGIMGELDHPQSLNINLDRVSHVITELWMHGNNTHGKAKIINTPMGNIAQELVRSGVKVGVSSRGAGTVAESGDVQGFQFITMDIVAQPSAPDAFPTSMYESLQHAKNGNKILTLAEQIQQDPAAQKYFKKEILKFLSEGLFAKNTSTK